MQSAESDTPVTGFRVLLRTSRWIELSTLHQVTLLDPAKLINFVFPWSNTESLAQSIDTSDLDMPRLLQSISRRNRVERQFLRQSNMSVYWQVAQEQYLAHIIQKLFAGARAVVGYTTFARYPTKPGGSEPSRHRLGPSHGYPPPSPTMAYRSLPR